MTLRAAKRSVPAGKAGRMAACTLLLLLGTAACSPTGEGAEDTSTRPDGDTGSTALSQEVTNATNFHLLDFVGWNNADLDVFRHLHTADVKVEFGAMKTEGIDAHVAALQPMMQPSSRLISHSPVIAQGEWTCVVGTSAAPPNGKMVTVAKWRDGAISEEYISANLLAPGAAKPTGTGSAVASITNEDPDLKALVGAEQGWSCRLDRTADGKMMFTVSKAGGTADEQMVFVG